MSTSKKLVTITVVVEVRSYRERRKMSQLAWLLSLEDGNKIYLHQKMTCKLVFFLWNLPFSDNGTFCNLEKGTENIAADFDSVGNGRKLRKFLRFGNKAMACVSATSPCKIEIIFIYLHL